MTHRVAVIAGDGAGPEVVAEARKAVDALGLDLEWNDLPWGTDHFHEHGTMMPPDALEVVRGHDAVLLGAVGHPSVPDHVTLWGLLLPLRQGLDLYANLRPARLLDGVPSRLEGRPPVDMLFVRENTEGEYSGVGGRAHRGLELEVGIETSVFTRSGVRRVVEHAFTLAERRRGLLTSATKSNASRYGYVLWDEVVEEVHAAHPGVEVERVLVDALAARMVTHPASLDVVVASNLFGDILTDLAAVLQGGMGMAASASVGGDRIAVFEPVHGSAPDIAGQGIANPLGAIWSASLMLDHLGEPDAATRLMSAVESVCRDGVLTRDLGGRASTAEVEGLDRGGRRRRRRPRVTVEEVAFAGTTGLLAGGPSAATGVVVAHGGRAPGKHLFRDEIVALAERGHLALAPDTRLPPPGDARTELRGFEAVLEIHRQALDLLARRGATRLGFYGHSNGGTQGAAMSARDPRLSAVVIAGMGTGHVAILRSAGFTDPEYLAAVDRLDPIRFVTTPGPARLFQQGVHDDVVPQAAARALYEAAAEPKQWREYDCGHGVDADPQARLDRYAFLEAELRRP